ncbi:MAG: DNA polymerase III subunit chi [Proteobacteria bacterium]|nr:DNA polymerase III subunit chi [Pseudomonadota bacterium]
MTEVSFYHLQIEPLEKALPRLLEKVLARDFRVLVRAVSEELLETLDDSLWTFKADSFLPHARADDTQSPELQPIILTTEEGLNPNSANVLALLEDAAAEDLTSFDRCLYMFNGNDDEALALARARWKKFKDGDVLVSYHQQTDQGWQKKA